MVSRGDTGRTASPALRAGKLNRGGDAGHSGGGTRSLQDAEGREGASGHRHTGEGRVRVAGRVSVPAELRAESGAGAAGWGERHREQR